MVIFHYRQTMTVTEKQTLPCSDRLRTTGTEFTRQITRSTRSRGAKRAINRPPAISTATAKRILRFIDLLMERGICSDPRPGLRRSRLESLATRRHQMRSFIRGESNSSCPTALLFIGKAIFVICLSQAVNGLLIFRPDATKSKSSGIKILEDRQYPDTILNNRILLYFGE